MAQVDSRLIGMDVTSKFGSTTINVLFCSTHSDEMLCAALNAFATQPEKLVIYRLDRDPDGAVSGKWRNYQTAVEICAAGFDLR